jgi:hypothetical protein
MGIGFGFRYYDDEAKTRERMLAEIDYDVAQQHLFLSDRLNHGGRVAWLEMLRAAVKSGTERGLSDSIRGRLNPTYLRRKPRSFDDYVEVRMPHNAHEVLGEGEFNRFYIRALCLRAREEGRSLVIYRAKEVENPRPESEARIGCYVDATELLDDLRANHDGANVLGVPGGPCSGISVRLVD